MIHAFVAIAFIITGVVPLSVQPSVPSGLPSPGR